MINRKELKSNKYCPLISFRSGSGNGCDNWVKCIGSRCGFFDDEFMKCGAFIISYSLIRNFEDRFIDGAEGREVKK